MSLPADYSERVYAGVLGKIIGVYLGRPFEGWHYDKIMAELGEIDYYVNDRVELPLNNHLLVVTDDDISGTFVFPRALREIGDRAVSDLTAEDVGRTWLNQIIYERTVLWWGGLGNSTEHTAYLRMKAGVVPPASGSIAVNGQVVAEQVGAQIFVEGFAMTCPGDPAAAADLAELAASVSHDGEAVQAARVVAALVAQAFVATDMDQMLDTATSLIRPDSLIRTVIDDVRGWAAGDWHRTRQLIGERYGYDRYGGNCHVVPNHAIVIAALAHSGGDFSQAMRIVNTCGWDTDSNAGNVGAITGVLGGLAGLAAGPDWRTPVADRMYLPTAEGGASVTDAATVAVELTGYGLARRGEPPTAPKLGARFHFSFPGSVQGFCHAEASKLGVLTIRHDAGRRTVATTPTFIPPEAQDMPSYGLVASPTLYSGQVVRAKIDNPVEGTQSLVGLVIGAYGADDLLHEIAGPIQQVQPGESAELTWRVPDTDGQPVAEVGLAMTGDQPGAVELDWLTWEGCPDVRLGRPTEGGTMWRRAWVDALDRFAPHWPEPYRIVQDTGSGMLSQGCRDWRDYIVEADVTPHLATAVGVAARVQGLERFYGLELVGRSTVRLVRHCAHQQVLGTDDFAWTYGTSYRLALEVDGQHIRGSVDGRLVVEVTDTDSCLAGGAVALTVTEGRTATQSVSIHPITLKP